MKKRLFLFLVLSKMVMLLSGCSEVVEFETEKNRPYCLS